MEYEITRLVMSCKHSLEISNRDFSEVKLAKKGLVIALGIEEKLDILLQSYIEYEGELHALTLKHTIFSDHTWSTFQNGRLAIDRRLVNLLTACRLYIDHIPHDIKSVIGEGTEKEELLKQRISQEYDSNFGYRVIDALRNYVQHRGLPVYHLSYGAERQENVSGIYSRHTITPSLSVSRLKEEKKFKRTVLKELEAQGELIDLKPLVRQYMESIGRIHIFIRELLADSLAKHDSTILDIRKSFLDRFGEETLGLAVIAREDTGGIADSEDIFEDLITYRKWLVQKNGMLTRYDSEIISSESRRDV